ncbi:MAG: hypothetical protein WEB00_09800 [Dehalococcoidia bacterium]
MVTKKADRKETPPKGADPKAADHDSPFVKMARVVIDVDRKVLESLKDK